MIPLKIINRLYLGRPVAAEITAAPLRRAWVHVRPIIDMEGCRLVRYPSEGRPFSEESDDRIERTRFDRDPVLGYEVRRIEIEQKYLGPDGRAGWQEVQNCLKDPSTLDDIRIVGDNTELEYLLLSWLPDLTVLGIPDNVGYGLPGAYGPVSAGDSLWNAVTQDNLAALKDLLALPGIDTDMKTKKWTVGLSVAVCRSSVEMAQLLLDQGAAISEGILNDAVKEDSTEMVRLLLERGAGVEVDIHRWVDTPLTLAAQQGNVEIGRMLLQWGADVNATDRPGHTPLDWAVYQEKGEMIALLQQAGGRVSRRPILPQSQSSHKKPLAANRELPGCLWLVLAAIIIVLIAHLIRQDSVFSTASTYYA